jgi:hypothetical protein
MHLINVDAPRQHRLNELWAVGIAVFLQPPVAAAKSHMG